MFIVIDWIDGSGKGTQLKRVEEELKSQGKTVAVYDFPRYVEASSYFVKKYLNWEYGESVDPKTASTFYALDRYDASFAMKKDIETFDYVISNRYVTSNMIHQAGKIHNENEFKEFLLWLDNLEYEILWIPRPDKVIFLNVSPEMSQQLVGMKEKREYIESDKNVDLHEKDKDHLINAHKKAVLLTEMFENWIKIDCEKNWEMEKIEDITKKIIKEIQ